MTRAEIEKQCTRCRHSNIKRCTNTNTKSKGVSKLYDALNKKSNGIYDITNSKISNHMIPNKLYKSMTSKRSYDFSNGKLRINNLSAFRENTTKYIGDIREGNNFLGECNLVREKDNIVLGNVKNLSQGPNTDNIYIQSFSYVEGKINPDRDLFEIFDTKFLIENIITEFKKQKNVIKIFLGGIDYVENTTPYYVQHCPLTKPEDFVFKKDNTFKSQHEFRLAFFVDNSYICDLNNRMPISNHVDIDIGNISNIIKKL